VPYDNRGLRRAYHLLLRAGTFWYSLLNPTNEAARGRFRVSADTPDQVELFQGVARRVSEALQRPVASYANGREIVITFGQPESPVLALG